MTPSDPAPPFPLPTILTYPSPSATTPATPTLITQGAEGRIYLTHYLSPSTPAALKYRPPKPYRHPTLDARLTRTRIVAEARILQRCRRDGVGLRVPAVYWVDGDAGCLLMEWVDGEPVRKSINAWVAARRAAWKAGRDGKQDGEEGEGGESPGKRRRVEEDGLAASLAEDPELVGLLRRMGAAVGGIHKLGLVHGDLTTSNMMLRPPEGKEGGGKSLEGDIVVIDFGLATQSTYPEDKAVDLYVLERAFGSTHPQAEHLFGHVLEAYGEAFKQAGPVLKKLEEVRMRGRKRSMVG